MARFKGRKMLIVNVASECGYTPQYSALQELYENFSDQLVIIGFPSNDFGGQEPGTNEQIQAFCSRRFGVTFPLAAKVNIKGPEQHPVFRWLTRRTENGVLDSEVHWNFTKFLISPTGRLEAVLPSSVHPLDPQILNWITA